MSKSKFSKIWSTQTNIAKSFGMSSIALGKQLKQLGYREDDGTPSKMAMDGGYVHIVDNSKDGMIYYMWNKAKINALLSSQVGKVKLSLLQFAVQEYNSSMKSIERDMASDPEIEDMYQNLGPDVIDSLVEDLARKLSKEDKILFYKEIKYEDDVS